MQGRQSLLTFLTVTRWSRSTSNFYVLIGQNLTGEFMRKIYAAPGTVRNIPKFKDKANWSRDTFQPMRRRACVYQQTNQNIAPAIKNFQNNGLSRTESVIVSRLSGIFLRLFMRHTQFFFICLLIKHKRAGAPSHWLKSVAWPVGPVFKFRDNPDCGNLLTDS